MADENGTEKLEDPGSGAENEPSVYLPGQPMDVDDKLVHDPSAYVMLHNANTVAPCLSFDIIKDDLGDNRETFPLSMYIISGTQAEKANRNRVILMKLSNLNKTQKVSKDDDDDSGKDSDEDSDEDDTNKKKPDMDFVQLKHHGCVNRIRTTIYNNSILSAVWSEMGKVTILDLKPYLQSLDSPAADTSSKNVLNKKEEARPLFVFSGHQTEGFAVDWSPSSPGMLATGDCRRNIHVWKPTNDSWNVDQRPLVGHQKSVEDIQWSPNEPNVLASCSVDKTIRIWDIRESPAAACKLTVENAHESDVNVISWNRNEPFIVSGGDDGVIHVWDLRVFQKGKYVAKLKHHQAPVSTVEWHPTDASVFASGGEDDQIALWDLEAERDDTNTMDEDVKDLPPQLLFIHQGQKEIKELHWHPQIPGVIVSTAVSGLNVFRTISI